MMGLAFWLPWKGAFMFRKRFVLIFASICLIPILACNLSAPAAVGGTNPDPAAATAAIQTQVALLVASTSAAQTALANALAGTQTALPTNTPEFTSTPSYTPTETLTPTPTFTLTPSTPLVTVSMNTNCRTGPGDPYDLVGVLAVGKTAEVIGQSGDGGFWIIRLPDNPAKTCWLWNQYATVSGNWQALPVLVPPPSPTPAPGFNASYVEMVSCMGEFAFTFKISNTGSVTWESIRVVEKDTVTTTVNTHTRDSFKRYSGCTSSGEDLNLEPGEIGYATTVLPGQFAYNPTGHAMKAAITLCSKDALAGKCQEQTITFTP
jgi:uncharacterized protein YgiM (DUF1202 family)